MNKDEINEIEKSLRTLLRGKYTSLMVGFNDQHACNYCTAEEYEEQYDKSVHWVSVEEREKALKENSVWTLQWYPDTPIGSYCIGASSLFAVLSSTAAKNPRPL